MTDFQSLIFYIICFILSALFYTFYCKKNIKVFLLLAVLIPLIVGGFRYMVGTDYMNYYNCFQNNSFVDPGFYMVSSVSKIFGNATAMFFIYNALTLLFFFLGLNNIEKKYRPLAYYCFLFLFFTTSFNAMRQMLSVCIMFYAYKYALKKNILPFLVLVVFASLFHITALLSAFLYPIMNIKKKFLKTILYILVIITVLFYQNVLDLLSSTILFEHYSIYQTMDANVAFNNYSFFIEAAVLLYLLFFRKLAVSEYNQFDRFLSVFIISVILLLLGFFNPYLKRISLYFSISCIISLSVVPYSFSNKKDRLLNWLAIVFFVVLRFIIQAFVLGQSDLIPYSFVEF